LTTDAMLRMLGGICHVYESLHTLEKVF